MIILLHLNIIVNWWTKKTLEIINFNSLKKKISPICSYNWLYKYWHFSKKKRKFPWNFHSKFEFDNNQKQQCRVHWLPHFKMRRIDDYLRILYLRIALCCEQVPANFLWKKNIKLSTIKARQHSTSNHNVNFIQTFIMHQFT